MSYTGDVSHATRGLVDLAERHFAAKCAHDLDRFVSFYSERGLTYADATLGWVFPDHDAFRAVLANYMPNWGEGVSYSTQLLGDERSAVLAVRDSPELFGGEIIGLSAADFDDEGKIVRFVDYWDSRHFGVGVADQLRVPADQFPQTFGEESTPSRASSVMRGVVEALADTLDSADPAAAAALFTVDATVTDSTLRTVVPGRSAIERYWERAGSRLPYGSGARVRHVLGDAHGGGYEWVNAGHSAPRGITALALTPDGEISSLRAVWDGALVEEAVLRELSGLALEV